MARTNPHHDWPEQSATGSRSNGAEWESLRNELVALLDQVEDHVATSAAEQAQQPAMAPKPAPQPEPTRHNAALKNVRQAVSRLADRSGDDKPVMGDTVVDAINQIRARQGAASAPAPTPQPEPALPQPEPAPKAAEPAPTDAMVAPSGPAEAEGLAKSLDALGERIGNFESQIGSRLDTLDNRADISGQITQLSEVIELLANAVGETGQIHRIEAQIGNLAEMLVTDRAADAQTSAQRIEQLTATVEKFVSHQVESTQQDMQHSVEAQERQAESMELIERSVRSIYDRIDALEASKAEPAYVERLSKDMAALTEAVSTQREPQSLLEKIDALSERIGMVEAPSQNEAETLAQSVTALREIIAETIAPRFDALETRMETLTTAPAASDSDAGAIEAQLRSIARRVEETSAQLKAMSTTPASAGPDIDAIAERIIERANTLAPRLASDPDEIDKADLASLEDRLAALFARSAPDETNTATHLEGVKTSITQVDNRIARLEEMLNGRDAAAAPAAAVATPQPAPTPRKAPDDAMPHDPATGSARRVLSQNAHIELREDEPEPEPEPAQPTPEPALAALAVADPEPEPELAKGFAIDPDGVERPAKPQSSLAAARENPFGPSPKTASPDAVSTGVSSATRSSFIEAARRSARQPDAEASEPRSLIGRAMSRFQRSEAETEETAALHQPDPVLEHTDPVVPQSEDHEPVEGDSEVRPGFITRNRRALLLGTALVVAVMMAVPLFLDRAAPSSSEPQAPAAQSVETPAAEPAAEAPVEAAPLAQEPAPAPEPVTPEPLPAEQPVGDVSSIEPTTPLASDVRVIDQQPSLMAARVNASTLTGEPIIDPIQTAAISASSDAATPDAMTSAAMPEISVSEDIEPAELRAAAEAGDMYAQFEVGAILTEGTIVEQDFTQAAAWYERSAAQGFIPAQYRLGSLFESGRGVDRDLEMSRLWYQRAAEAGNRMSMHNLASLYAGGELETQDFGAAAHWFEEAASRGLTDSQFNLGMLHARGLGVEQDFEQSYIWFSLAARAGDQDAAEARDDVARSLDSATVLELDDTIASWTPAEFDLAANFAPIGTWDEAFDPGPEITNSDVILQVQVLLSKLGYDIGTPDGIVGPKTREAIASFETETGMDTSGSINPRLLAVLGSQPV